MTNNQLRTLTPAFRKKTIRRQTLPFVATCAVFWGLFLIRWLADFDILDWLANRGDPGSEKLYLYLAMGCTIVAIPLAILTIRRALHLATHGIEVTATVLTVGIVTRYSHVPVEICYEFRETTYRKKMDVYETYAGVGNQIELLVDPSNPKRFMQRADLFRTAEESTIEVQGLPSSSEDNNPIPPVR